MLPNANPYSGTTTIATGSTLMLGSGASLASPKMVVSGKLDATALGGFTVSGTHTYAKIGSFTVSVTINDTGGSTASTTSTAVVAKAEQTIGAYDTTTAIFLLRNENSGGPPDAVSTRLCISRPKSAALPSTNR